MWDSESQLQLHLLALRKNGLHNKRVHYSLSFTAYKAASGGVFLRYGTLSLGYNCTSWPCAKMVSTIKGSSGTLLPWLHSLYGSKWGGFFSMWNPEPWLQLHLLTLRKNGLHNKRQHPLTKGFFLDEKNIQGFLTN